jgi:hypothetical protein
MAAVQHCGKHEEVQKVVSTKPAFLSFLLFTHVGLFSGPAANTTSRNRTAFWPFSTTLTISYAKSPCGKSLRASSRAARALPKSRRITFPRSVPLFRIYCLLCSKTTNVKSLGLSHYTLCHNNDFDKQSMRLPWLLDLRLLTLYLRVILMYPQCRANA